jgi:hypothetical protein
MAAIDHGAIAQQIDLETCEIGHPIGGAAEARRMGWREQQRAVQAIGDDGVGGRELPARKDRLHDLEALCHPVDAAEQRRLIHVGGGRVGKAEHDLRLDARLGEVRQRKRVLCCLARRRETSHRGVEHESPHRRVYAIFGPNGTVGEADLAADHAFAARRSQFTQAGQDAIGVLEGKAGIARRERCNLARAVHRRERLCRDGFVIWWGKGHAVHHICRLRQRHRPPLRFAMRASLHGRFFPGL